MLPVLRSFPEPVLDQLDDECKAPWGRKALPLPFPEYALVVPTGNANASGHVLVFHVMQDPVEDTIHVTPFQKLTGYPWSTRMTLRLNQGTEAFDYILWLGDAAEIDETYGYEYRTIVRSMTYLIVKAPEATTQTPQGSATLRALNRKLPARKQVPPSAVITVDVGRPARPQTAPLPTGKVMPPHNRKGHERRIVRANGTVNSIPVRACKINGGGPVRDYKVET